MENKDKLYVINDHRFVAESTEEALQMWNDFNTGNSDKAKEIETLVLDKKNSPVWTREKIKELLETYERMKYM